MVTEASIINPILLSETDLYWCQIAYICILNWSEEAQDRKINNRKNGGLHLTGLMHQHAYIKIFKFWITN